ncbi:MAG: pseudaminic acid synthase [candidate division Zixibacteria bacterium]|nr:pseudaminic acid synthase [candidate division Zixibacteria bacterium]
MREIVVNGRNIGSKVEPFIIAEMSGNHNQSLERALAIVDAAAASGAHALKIQTYTAATMTLDLNASEFRIDDPRSLWRDRSLYDLYTEAHTPWAWHKPIFDRCRERGLIAFSTPFDASAVELLESLGVPMYKVASFENTDLPLIKLIAATRKPMIISTGMATVAELDDSIKAARGAGCDQIVLLKCTSAYPAAPEDINLRTIPHLRQLFDVEVGLSDHTLGLAVSLAAIALGATVIEKHFTLSRADGGVDSAFSLEPCELRTLTEESRRAWQALGKVHYGISEAEKKSLQFRRSLYVTQDMRKGDRFSSENLRAIRPGLGLAPKYLDMFLGRRVARDTKKGTPVTWELLG